MVNADRDFVQQETARFWHRHDVVRTALRVFVLVKFGFLVKFGISCPLSFCTFAISVVSAGALSGQLDAGSDACEGDIRLKCSFFPIGRRPIGVGRLLVRPFFRGSPSK
jgi:hypothetical protein